MKGTLQLTVVEAVNLMPADMSGLSDPYCKITWRDQTYRTSVERSTLNPVWNQTFDLPFDGEGGDPALMSLTVKDWDRWKPNDPLGRAMIDLRYLKHNITTDNWHRLDSGQGQLRLRLCLKPNPLYHPDQITYQRPPVPVRPPGVGCSPDIVIDEVPSPAHGGQKIFVYQPPNQTPEPTPAYPLLSVSPPPPKMQKPSHESNELTENDMFQDEEPLPPQSVNLLHHHHPPGTADKVQHLLQVLPQCSAAQIVEALHHNGYDEDKAMDELLNELVGVASTCAPAQQQHAEQQKLFNTAVINMFGTNDDDDFDVFASKLPPVKKPQYGHSACSPMASMVAPEVAASPDDFVPPSGRRRSLLIGINYEGTKEKLKGCCADVGRIQKVITSVYGFPDDHVNMLVLTDENQDNPSRLPTRRNIVNGMKWLTHGVQSGDVLFFHYSGHGSQKRNNKGTELDGFDETILPLDWRKAGHIIDDELSECLVRHLPNGVKLTAILDCCHSGTGMDLPYTWDGQKQSWTVEYSPCFSAGDVQLISGCRSDQTSADVNSAAIGAGGAMTFAIVVSLTAKPFGHTYPSFMRRLHKALEARGFKQKPQLSTTQRFNLNRKFSLTDIVPNTNKYLGREGMRLRTIARSPSLDMPGLSEDMEEEEEEEEGGTVTSTQNYTSSDGSVIQFC